MSRLWFAGGFDLAALGKVGLLSLLATACAGPQPSLEGGVPLFARDRLPSGGFAVEEEIIYEVDLSCRISLPFNSETLGLEGADLAVLDEVETASLELEPAPSPLYTLGVETEVRRAVLRRRDHLTWLELATLEPVPGLGDYEETRDASRQATFAGLRRLRGPETTDMDLVQAKVREYHLEATVAFRVPSGIRNEALELERRVGGVLTAFFISPELPGEGVTLTLAAPAGRRYEVEVSRGEACPRLVLRREEFLGVAP